MDKKKAAKALLDKRAAAEDLYVELPFFYDRTKVFWLWDKENYCYHKMDETDILNEVAGNTEVNTISTKDKNEILEALKQVGRENMPKKIKDTWVQFHDKVVDVATGEEFKASYKYFVTNPIPWELGNSSETPVMDRIFKEWVGEDYVKTLYEIIAYCTLPSYPIHRAFCFIGGGMNGKSKYLDLISNFLSQKNIATSDFDQLINNRFETYTLYKKLACFIGETNFSELNKTSTFKRLTGQDQIRFEIKGKDIFTDYNYAKLLIATNSLPQTTDKTVGFYRRWTIIKFPNQFSEKKDILAEIPDYEMNNLAMKCIGLLQELLNKRHFHNEGDIKKRMEHYEDISDPMQKFLRDYTFDDPDGYTFKFELKDKFQAWERRHGYRIWGDKEITQYLKSKGYEIGKKNYTSENGTKRYRAWLGLSLKSFKQKDESVQVVQHVQQSSLSPPARESELRVLDNPDNLDTPPSQTHKKQNEYTIDYTKIEGLVDFLDRYKRLYYYPVDIEIVEKFFSKELIEKAKEGGYIYEPKNGFYGVL